MPTHSNQHPASLAKPQPADHSHSWTSRLSLGSATGRIGSQLECSLHILVGATYLTVVNQAFKLQPSAFPAGRQ